MPTRLAPITVALVLLIPAAAFASLADEQRQGQNQIAQLNAGTTTCRALSAGDLDHIGEYVMFRALGSTTLHQAMNDRMRLMLGEQGESGCTSSSGPATPAAPLAQAGLSEAG